MTKLSFFEIFRIITDFNRRDRFWLGGRGGISLFIPFGKRSYEPKNAQIFDFSPIRAGAIHIYFRVYTNLLIFKYLDLKCGNVCKSVEYKTLIFKHLHFKCGNVPQFSTILQIVPKI